MNPNGTELMHAEQIDRTLAVLAAVQPRAGLEQRVLAHLESAPRLAWYQRWIAMPLTHHRWTAAAASAALVAGGIGLTAYHPRPAAPHAPLAVRVPRTAQQPAATAASVGVSQHPQESTTARHRGVRRSFRAMHVQPAPLPHGTVIPTRPHAVPPQ